MKNDRELKREFYKKLELLNENGKQKVFEYIDLLLTVDYTRADHEPQNAQVVNFESKRP